MSIAEISAYVVTLVGCFGFWLGGKKIWWSWYVNIANQLFWVVFALASGYEIFLIGTLFYSITFIRNAYLWTKEHFDAKKPNRDNYCYGRWDGENWIAKACTVPGVPHPPHDIPKEDQGWDFNRVATPNIEIYDNDIPPEVHDAPEAFKHPLIPKFEVDPLMGVLCTGRPPHPDCEMPVLAHKPHFVIPKG